MKIPLRDQIAYMERHRDKGLALAKSKPELMASVHISEGIILTLAAYEAFVLTPPQQRETTVAEKER